MFFFGSDAPDLFHILLWGFLRPNNSYRLHSTTDLVIYMLIWGLAFDSDYYDAIQGTGDHEGRNPTIIAIVRHIAPRMLPSH